MTAWNWMEIQGVFQSLPNDSFNKRQRLLFGKTTKVLAALKEFMFLSVEKCEGEKKAFSSEPKEKYYNLSCCAILKIKAITFTLMVVENKKKSPTSLKVPGKQQDEANRPVLHLWPSPLKNAGREAP